MIDPFGEQFLGEGLHQIKEMAREEEKEVLVLALGVQRFKAIVAAHVLGCIRSTERLVHTLFITAGTGKHPFHRWNHDTTRSSWCLV